MKTNIGVLVLLCTSFMHGMEKENIHEMEQENAWSITAYGTKITLHKGDILDTYVDDQKKVDFIIVGHYQQTKLEYFQNKSIGFCDDASGCYKGYKMRHGHVENGKRIGNKFYFPVESSCNALVEVVDPYVYMGFESYNLNLGAVEKKYLYEQRRLDNNGCGVVERYTGDQVIEVVLQDVKKCYENVLAYVADKNDKKLHKSIAVPALSAQKYWEGTYRVHTFPKDKLAPVAIKTMLEFIKNNTKAFDCMELFVDDDAYRNLYILLLLDNLGVTKNFSLFLFAHKEFASIVSSLPRELIHYIANLISHS